MTVFLEVADLLRTETFSQHSPCVLKRCHLNPSLMCLNEYIFLRNHHFLTKGWERPTLFFTKGSQWNTNKLQGFQDFFPSSESWSHEVALSYQALLYIFLVLPVSMFLWGGVSSSGVCMDFACNGIANLTEKKLKIMFWKSTVSSYFPDFSLDLSCLVLSSSFFCGHWHFTNFSISCSCT